MESKLAPVIFKRSVEQYLIYSAVIADGDDKSILMLKERNIYSEYLIDISRKECLSHVQKRIRIHLIEKQKAFVEKMKTEMNNLLAQCKTKNEEQKIRENYRRKTKRDLKHDREAWGSVQTISEINLLSDGMIDKITSLYGLVIKNSHDQPVLDIQNALIGIINNLSANELNCEEMHKFCKKGKES